MKHATLPLLAGLLCLSAISIASAAPPAAAPTHAGPVRFEHGIPVFELPTIVVTPDGDEPAPAHIAARRADEPKPVEPSHDNPARAAGASHIEVDATGYTAMRVVAR